MAQHIYSQYLEYSFQAEYLIAGPVVEHYYNLPVEHIQIGMTVVAQYYIKDKADTFRILDTELSSEQYGIGFKKGNEALRDQIQTVLESMAADGKFEEIAKKWDQQDVICLNK